MTPLEKRTEQLISMTQRPRLVGTMIAEFPKWEAELGDNGEADRLLSLFDKETR